MEPVTDESSPPAAIPAPSVKERSIFDDWCAWGAVGSVFTATKDAYGPPAQITYEVIMPPADNPEG